jgi:hypothetical protein
MSSSRSRPIAGLGSAIALAALLPFTAHAAPSSAVEFYHPVLKHYFLTADADEIAGLDAGTVIKGWTRTGGQFGVYTDPGPDRLPVCRFFGVLGPNLSSHFYTSDPAECAYIKTRPPWQYERVAYYIQAPSNGACAPGTTPVYRSFFSDQVSDVNHRFTVDLTVAARQPLKAGWVSEGIVMCARSRMRISPRTRCACSSRARSARRRHRCSRSRPRGPRRGSTSRSASTSRATPSCSGTTGPTRRRASTT